MTIDERRSLLQRARAAFDRVPLGSLNVAGCGDIMNLFRGICDELESTLNDLELVMGCEE